MSITLSVPIPLTESEYLQPGMTLVSNIGKPHNNDFLIWITPTFHSHPVQTDNWRNIVFLLLIHFHTDNCIMKKVNIQFFTHDKQVNSWVYRNLIFINVETPYQTTQFHFVKAKRSLHSENVTGSVL